MAKKNDGPPPSGPTAAAGEATPTTSGPTAPADAGQASGSAELRPHQQEAVAGVQTAEKEKAKKKGTRNVELRLMGYIDRRLRSLPVKARKRVVEWMKEYDIEDEG